MSKDYLKPFDTSYIQMETKVVRSRDVENTNYNINTNRGDLARQINKYKNDYLRANGYDPEEFNNVDSEELSLLEQLKAQYGNIENIKDSLNLNTPPPVNTAKLDIPFSKPKDPTDKLIDDLLAEFEI
jgi:hypothetical protein